MEKMSEERINMGWSNDTEPPFVFVYYNNKSLCDDIISKADVLILGSPLPKFIKMQRKGEIILLYSERIFKFDDKLIDRIKYFFAYKILYGFRKNIYCLAAGAFVYYDFSKILCFKNKCYDWGYFPVTFEYDINQIIKNKNDDVISILFVGRFISWKHPEIPLQIANRLKNDNITFHLTMIGAGYLYENIIEMISEYNLKDCVDVIQSLSPLEVREMMIKSNIMLFTSDKNEGWGAVLNESMNSGCAVVASNKIGSVPCLLINNHNGYVYSDGDFEDLYTKVLDLCLSKTKRERFGFEAYKTIVEKWNAKYAAERLLELIRDLKQQGYSSKFTDGPCCKSKILKDR
jgi:glycosyltransferase involved in cell wall biosynthesis